ncbi:hypothetical protein RI129_013252 [Pyrocoelia pectoralis]|uniref:Ketosynthase family 3 (KS3) domain-containing protein n=1 Tax=Pyrocoelia pectoralis TaxID=417401 RepID=A0AAN7ZCX8_9COLE
MRLYQDTYNDCMIAPSSVDLLEAHGTGTRIGDKEETAAIDAVFCQNRKEPLPIGSVKSYIGHTEGTSFLASLVKVLVGMENNHILPNINFNTPSRYIDGLIKGRLMVPVEIMPWPEKGSGLAAINSFGIGASNAHVVLKRFRKEKSVEGLLDDGLPRLICVSGRSDACVQVQSILNDIETREIDIEYCRLIQQVFKDSESLHSHRGFIIRSTKDVIERRCTKVARQKPELHLFFSEPNRDIVEIGRQLYELQPFAEAVGSAYMMGFPICPELMYPPINWPVSRGTPMISPIIKWNHEMDWFYTKAVPPQIERKVTVLAKHTELSCVPGHVINGLVVMPATGYLYIVWETFNRLLEVPISVTRVTFENIKFHSVTPISDNCNEFYVTISKITHKFEVIKHVYAFVWYLYLFRGAFRGLEQSDLSGTVSKIKWQKNWITFIDGILQTNLLHLDTRKLLVPSVIEQITIDAPRHFASTNVESRAVHNHRETKIFGSEAVQVRGFSTVSLMPRKVTKPLIECYKFVPLETELPLGAAVRVLVQIFVENSLTFNVKVVEVVENNFETDILGPILEEALNDQPFVESKVLILNTTKSLKSKCLSNESHDANRALREDGVVISRENPNFNSLSSEEFVIASVVKTEKETLILLTKASHFFEYKIITTNLNGSKFDWMEEIQGAVKNEKNVLLVVQDEPLSGVLGFTKCLRRELGGAKFKCVFIMDEDTRFNVSDAFFSQQMQRGLAINILKDGVWGTYRHLLLEDEKEVERQHIFNDLLIPGDYSSLRWVEGPLSLESKKAIVRVFSAGINFKDVIAASGKIPEDGFTKQRLQQSTAQGMEFSGKDLRGRRVMGIVPHGALSTLVEADVSLLWPMPDNWSMEDGASVPITYSTVLYGLVNLARIVHGETILIHSGSRGVGQAAINLALRYKCDIFTTVGSEEKRQFIIDTYPEIPESHIGNSRDCTFEQMVLKYTKGRGVNIVLNSISEQKLEASLRCLARNGRFIEIGRHDLVNNKYISLSHLGGGRRYCGAMLNVFLYDHPSVKVILWNIVHNALEKGIIKPLRCKSYTRDDVEHIYRNMVAGNDIGKMIVKIREEHKPPTVFKGLPRFWCDSHMTYVVVGGLGGFGLELVDWMVLKGARKFLLISRSGIKNGYGASRIRLWKSYGANIHVVIDDISNPEICGQILRNAEQLGPVAGIFNLALVLQDALFENQTEESFIEALTPKATITHNLDKLSRKLCPSLKCFVVFSSISCGRGNMEQTNYGMGNSIAERICEKRKKEGFPGLAIQWGIIGDVCHCFYFFHR